jgi:hypothetical protein
MAWPPKGFLWSTLAKARRTSRVYGEMCLGSTMFTDSKKKGNPGLIRTIGLILGFSPLNQMDVGSTPLRDCFTDIPDSMAADVSLAADTQTIVYMLVDPAKKDIFVVKLCPLAFPISCSRSR